MKKRKIGRNDPCPCGSGKKFKKCCIDNPERVARYVYGLLTYEEVDEMSTGDIIRRLEGMGIPFDEDVFSEDIEQHYSAWGLSEDWFKIFDVTAKGREEDFPWLAAWILWERLAPSENMPAERIGGLIDEGIQHISDEDSPKGCDIWLKAWEAINYRHQPGCENLSHLDEQYKGLFFVSNLCQDLEIELRNAGLKDSAYFKKRIDYCREFLNLFPDENDLITHNMRRAIAESYADLGDYEQADLESEKLAKDYPDNPWSYIAWGDIYYFDKKDDYDRARELYMKALAVAEDEYDIMAVQERLEDLEDVIRSQQLETPS